MSDLSPITPYIDFSRMPPPTVIEEVDFEALLAVYKQQILNKNPALERALSLEQSPTNHILGAQAYGETILRKRINAAVRALLAIYSRSSDLDSLVARQGIQRLVLETDGDGVPTRYETDAALRRRYFLSFDRASAGSADRYLFEVFTAAPLLHDAAVLGYGVHGRRGDVDIIIIGENGLAVTNAQLAAVSAAVNSTSVKPEATSVSVLPAERKIYDVELVVEIARGPDPVLIKAEVEARLNELTRGRMQIGGEVPAEAISGAAYGPGVILVRRQSPATDVVASAYEIPILGELTVTVVAR
jgi:phage-related baseplate assembly protein